MLVVGAGPSGSMVSRQLAKGGYSVLLTDKTQFPRRKVCGCYLNGSALATLHCVGLGDLPTRLKSPVVHRVCMGIRGRTTELSLPEGAAISRDVLDTELAREAIAAGAEFLSQCVVRVGHAEATNRGVRHFEFSAMGETQSRPGTAKVIVVADGVSGQSLKNCEDIQFQFARKSLIGTAAVTRSLPQRYVPGTIHMAIGKSGYLGALQLQDGMLDVAGAFDPADVKRSSVGEIAQKISDESGLPRLKGLDSLDWRGTPPLSRSPSKPAAERLFLVGDAAGYVEPFTGEGMSWALASGRAVSPMVVKAVEGETTEAARQWCLDHRRLFRSKQRACHLLTRSLRHPVLVSVCISALSRLPSLASPMIRWVNQAPKMETL